MAAFLIGVRHVFYGKGSVGDSCPWNGWIYGLSGQNQQPSVMSDAELNKEAATADSLYSSQNMVGALPLYEDLHKRQPESNVWRERLAGCC